jgi:programmed cell death protein 5
VAEEEEEAPTKTSNNRNSNTNLGSLGFPEAADRLGRIRLVKASRADDVENRLIMLARSGQLRQKITEAQLKDMLGQLSESEPQEQKITVTRRKGGWDDDDDLDDLLNS